MKQQTVLKDAFEISVPCVRVKQPIGEFFVAAVPAKILREITMSDVRRLQGEREFETYLGIQRKLDPKRVIEINQYVHTVDATFPTAVILAVDGNHAQYDEQSRTLTLRNFDGAAAEHEREYIQHTEVAKVLDGQHRIEGLKGFDGTFDINVSIFVDMDIQNQAYVFSTVNLAQTKVSKSLAYDLFEYSKARSPQKTCHNIAVALDQKSGSPFEARIKRLGDATPGRTGELITQATFVEALLPYITRNKIQDRDLLLRGKTPVRTQPGEEKDVIFRNHFLDGRDLDIAEILFNYFVAIRQRWPSAWANSGTGNILNRSNAFKALMKFLRPAYLNFMTRGEVVSAAQFFKLFERSQLRDEDFTPENYLPGSSGQGKLYADLANQLRIG